MADRTRKTIRDGTGPSVTELVRRFVFISFVWKKPCADFPRREVLKFLQKVCQSETANTVGESDVFARTENYALTVVEHCPNKTLLVFCINLIKSKAKRIQSRGTVIFTEKTISVRKGSDMVMSTKREDNEVECLKETAEVESVQTK